MAVGDSARNAGYPLVPDSGDEGRVALGAQEINRTRDYIANVKDMIPNGIKAFQIAAGIGAGYHNPPNTDGAEGEIYFKIL